MKIRKFFDAHVHFRIETMLRDVIPYTAKYCSDAVAMGNLTPPVDSLARLVAYKQKIAEAAKNFLNFNPIMTIMLTESTTVRTIKDCAPYAKVLKFIPANTSTGSSQTGVSLENIEKYYSVLEELQKQKMIFSIHAERIRDDDGQEIPESIRERAALPFVKKIIEDFPGLKIIIEHVSTEEACKLVVLSPDNVAGTITAHHAYFNDSSLRCTDGKIKPEFYCKPVLKAERHRWFVEQVMLTGSPKFFFGSDSAPHSAEKKFRTNPPAAGIFSAPVAIPLIIEMFVRGNKLCNLENFLSIAGRNFYDLPIPKEKISINYQINPWEVEKTVGADSIPVLMAGKKIHWYLE